MAGEQHGEPKGGGFARVFIDRPVFAAVISIIITLVGAVAIFVLPVAQYPEIAPPTVQVSCIYPGANAQVVQDTIAAPIEQQVNGVENMLYMSSQCTNDGGYNLTVTFKLGTNLDMAQVLMQNRVALAMPVLPDVVKTTGVTTKKKSPSILLVVNFISPDGSRDQLYLSNFATIQVKDQIARLNGVGDVGFLGQQDYSMRLWLDPEKLAARNMTASDVVTALKEQNVQVAAGQIGQRPTDRGQDFQYTMSTLGRLATPEEFGDIILKTGADGQLVRVWDIVRGLTFQAILDQAKLDQAGVTKETVIRALQENRYEVVPRTGLELEIRSPVQRSGKLRLEGVPIPGRPGEAGLVFKQLVSSLNELSGVELGSKNLDTSCTLDGKPSVGLSIFQLPGTNALTTAEAIREKMKELRADKSWPLGVDYAIIYDTTPFIEESVHEVIKSLRDAIILVAIVVLAFLQNWRATLIPLIAVPVAIVGTCAALLALGYSLNNLSLFGLVLAIGIVVDDAIVVVEAVEHHLEHGLSPREATYRAMAEVSGPIVAISLVLMAVFIPCAFIAGITGQFFRQFAITIAFSTGLSAINSLTLSPALCALLLRQKKEQRDPLTLLLNGILGWFFKLFNLGFTWTTAVYTRFVGVLLRLALIVLLVYAGMLYLTYLGFTRTPTGFIPAQDKGYLLVNVQLPDSASVERTEAVLAKLDKIALAIPGVGHTIGIGGQSFLLNAVGSNYGSMFVVLKPFEERHLPAEGADTVVAELRRRANAEIAEAVVAAFGAPAVDGLGNAGGFKFMVQDRASLGLETLQGQTDNLVEKGNAQPGLVGLFNSFRANTPQLYVDIDRTKCKMLGLPLNEVFATLQIYLGSMYVNDFNFAGRTWQVNVQADQRFRQDANQVGHLKVRNAQGEMVPLESVAEVTDVGGPAMITRYNMYPAAAVNGASLPTFSTGQVIAVIDELAKRELPVGMGMEWTELTYLQIQAGNTALVVFAGAVVLVLLVLAAQYESWSLPMAVILVVPMCLLSSVVGVIIAKSDINIFVQIGFVVLVGLASKNAILIVEFAKAEREKGVASREATQNACRLRLRPIMMTSFAFILGVVPLMLGHGAGAEMRRALGVAVFSGMLGVTFFGIFLTPVFFFVIDWLFPVKAKAAPPEARH